MSLSPKDMDFIEAKHSASRDIALAFGVPPMLLGIPGDNTYANYQEANRAFYRMTVLPLVARTVREIVGLARACLRAGTAALVRRRPGRRTVGRARGAVGAAGGGILPQRRRKARRRSAMGAGEWGKVRKAAKVNCRPRKGRRPTLPRLSCRTSPPQVGRLAA